MAHLALLLPQIAHVTFGGGDPSVVDTIRTEHYANDSAKFEHDQAIALKLLPALAKQDMEFSQAERYLKAATSKPTSDTKLTDEELAVYLKFWGAERTKIHDMLAHHSAWNDRLASVSWRLDVKTKSRHVAELSDPAVIVELKVDGGLQVGRVLWVVDVGAVALRGPHMRTKAQPATVQFELSSEQLARLLRDVSAIEAQIEKLSS